MSQQKTREVKMSVVEILNKSHSTDIDLFSKLRHNFGAGAARNNLGSWFGTRKKLKLKPAHNTDDPSTSKYQSIGIGIIVGGPMTQYAKHDGQDLRKLGE
jgi:hypothetical protein